MKIKYLMLAVLAAVLPSVAVVAACPKDAVITSSKLYPNSVTIFGKGFKKGWKVQADNGAIGTITSGSSTKLEVSFKTAIGTPTKTAQLTIIPGANCELLSAGGTILAVPGAKVAAQKPAAPQLLCTAATNTKTGTKVVVYGNRFAKSGATATVNGHSGTVSVVDNLSQGTTQAMVIQFNTVIAPMLAPISVTVSNPGSASATVSGAILLRGVGPGTPCN